MAAEKILNSMNNITIISSIYPNKAYPCILRNTDYNIYEIYSCDWDVVKRSRERLTLDEAIAEIGLFYKNLLESDFVPYKVHIIDHLYIQRHDYYNIYDIITTTCYNGDTYYDLITNLQYNVALDKANQICEIIKSCQQQ